MVEAILAAVVALFGLIGTALTSGVNSSKKENDVLKRENAELRAQLEATKASSDVQLKEELSRRERVISELKAEIELLEKDDEAHKDPAAVRSRLNRMLNPVP